MFFCPTSALRTAIAVVGACSLLLSAARNTQAAVDTDVGIWINASEIAELPMVGDAWDDIHAVALAPCSTPDIFNQNDTADSCVLAKAIVSVRLLAENPLDAVALQMQTDVVAALQAAVSESSWCPDDGCSGCSTITCGDPACTQACFPASASCSKTCTRRTLALGRNLAPLLASAELIGDPIRTTLLDALDGTGNPVDPDPIEQGILNYQWVDAGPATSPSDTRTLFEACQERPNNWGAFACTSAAAAAIYRADEAEMTAIYDLGLGFVGDCTNGECSTFVFGTDASRGPGEGAENWTCSQQPAEYGINEDSGCFVDVSQTATPDWMAMGGAQPDDMRRAGVFPAGCDASPRACVPDTHIWEGLQGRIVLAWILLRQGLDLFEAADAALLRSFEFQHRPIWAMFGTSGRPHPPYLSKDGDADNDDAFLTYLINHVYETTYPGTPFIASPSYKDFGKGFGWTRYTHVRPCSPLFLDPDFDGTCVGVPAMPGAGAAALAVVLLGAGVAAARRWASRAA